MSITDFLHHDGRVVKEGWSWKREGYYYFLYAGLCRWCDVNGWWWKGMRLMLNEFQDCERNICVCMYKKWRYLDLGRKKGRKNKYGSWMVKGREKIRHRKRELLFEDKLDQEREVGLLSGVCNWLRREKEKVGQDGKEKEGKHWKKGRAVWVERMTRWRGVVGKIRRDDGKR